MKNNKLYPYIFISVALHAILLYWGIRKAEEKKPVEKKRPVQVSLIHLPPALKKEPKPQKQIVSLPDANNQVPEEADHLSEQNNSVAEETVAKQVGDAGGSASGSGGRDGEVPQTLPPGEGVNLFPPGAISDVARDLSGAGGNSNNNGDYVEGVKEGGSTALNAVEFKFASFFNRVKKDIQGHWRPLPLLYRLDPTGRLLDQERKTLLYVILDKDGYILDVKLYKSSGVDFLDDEAVRALTACKQFPNPPKGLIKDGRVEFFFGFQVYRGGGFLLW